MAIKNTPMLSFVKARLFGIFPHGGFARQMLSLSGATVISQIVSFISSPINTRLYNPSEYGLMAAFSSIFAIVCVLATMRYEMAIPIADDDKTAVHLLLLCFVLTLACCAVITFIAVLWGKSLSRYLVSDGSMSSYLWFLPIGILGTSTYTILSNWAIRKKEFTTISTSRILQSVNGAAVSIGMGLGGTGTIGLIAGQIVSQSSGVLRLLTQTIRDVNLLKANISFTMLIHAAKRFYRFPMFSVWSAFLNTVSIQMPIIVLSSQFGSMSTGQYSLGIRVLQLPLILISGAVSQVYYSRAQQAKSNGVLNSLTAKVVKALVVTNAFIFTFIIFFGPTLFSLIFGQQWNRAGEYAQYLAPWLFIVFIASPISTLTLVLERQGMDFVWQIIILVLRTATLVFASRLYNDQLAILFFGIVSFLLILCYMIWLFHLAALSIRSMFFTIIIEVAFAVILLGGCKIFFYLSQKNILLTALCILLATAIASLRSFFALKEIRSEN